MPGDCVNIIIPWGSKSGTSVQLSRAKGISVWSLFRVSDQVQVRVLPHRHPSRSFRHIALARNVIEGYISRLHSDMFHLRGYCWCITVCYRYIYLGHSTDTVVLCDVYILLLSISMVVLMCHTHSLDTSTGYGFSMRLALQGWDVDNDGQYRLKFYQTW